MKRPVPRPADSCPTRGSRPSSAAARATTGASSNDWAGDCAARGREARAGTGREPCVVEAVLQVPSDFLHARGSERVVHRRHGALPRERAVYGFSAYRFSSGDVPAWLASVFPASRVWRRKVESAIDQAFQWMTESWAGLFTGTTNGIRLLLDGMETLLVGTPWPVVMGVIVLLAYRMAGARVAVFTAAALAYLGVFGFWERSMTTVALLGTAALLCLVAGIPLGIWCARSPRVHAMVRPILDLMQTMPSFVYLIPVIAFFGIGKPPGILATVVFGMPPVVRLTILGRRPRNGVHQHRQGAGGGDYAYGAIATSPRCC